MTKIEPLEPICSPSGMFYCAGYVNGSYVHFLSDMKLTNKQLKQKLLNKYNRNHNFVIMERGK